MSLLATLAMTIGASNCDEEHRGRSCYKEREREKGEEMRESSRKKKEERETWEQLGFNVIEKDGLSGVNLFEPNPSKKAHKHKQLDPIHINLAPNLNPKPKQALA